MIFIHLVIRPTLPTMKRDLSVHRMRERCKNTAGKPKKVQYEIDHSDYTD